MAVEYAQVAVTAGTLMLGAGIAFAADARKNGWAARREREAAARHDERERKAFERATLIDLQDAVAAVTRASGAIHHRSEQEYKRTGTFGREPVGEWSDRFGEALANVHRFRVRVMEAELRQQVEAFADACVMATMGAMSGISDDEARMRAQHAADEAMSQRTPLDEAIGERLRALA